MFKKIIIGLVVIIAVFLVVVAVQPSHYHIERKATIAAAPAVVFAQVNDLHKWDAWSPWARLDPAMKQTFEGPPAGVGAIYNWAGNKDVGEGRMTITESHPAELINLKLEFLKPFASTCTTVFPSNGAGNQTNVTWSMDGKNNFIAKAFCLFMNHPGASSGVSGKGLLPRCQWAAPRRFACAKAPVLGASPEVSVPS